MRKMAEIVKKPKNTGVKVRIDADNTGFMAALNEIEEKIDRIQEKANRLKATLSECYVSVDLSKSESFTIQG